MFLIVSEFHFLTGLPRSGSTLPAAILRLSPFVHAGMTSRIRNLFQGLLDQASNKDMVASRPPVSVQRPTAAAEGVIEELVFVDPGVAEPQVLLRNPLARNTAPAGPRVFGRSAPR